MMRFDLYPTVCFFPYLIPQLLVLTLGVMSNNLSSDPPCTAFFSCKSSNYKFREAFLTPIFVADFKNGEESSR